MLATAHAQRGNLEVAIPYLQQAIESNPDNRVLARVDPDLPGLRAEDTFAALLESPLLHPNGDRKRPVRHRSARQAVSSLWTLRRGSAVVSDLHVVVLAAGKGTRMKSQTPKVLHPIAGRPIIDWVLGTAARLSPATTTVVVGHQGDAIREYLASRPDVQIVVQDPQLGTGHALLQTEPILHGREGVVLLLSGDVPLLTDETLRSLVSAHIARDAAATVLTTVVERPYGYGRIVRTNNEITRVVEERDATPAQRKINEVNSGIYAFALEPLFDALKTIGSENAQGEYYLPDLVGAYRRRRRTVATVTVEPASEVRGVNGRSELAEVSSMVRQQKNEELMAAGVTLVDPATTYIDAGVEVGADTVIHPCVFLEGATRIGSACEIHAGARLVNAQVGDRAVVKNHSVITDSQIGADAIVGPFAHLRPGSQLDEHAHVGNFVELKKTRVGRGSKANHLSYLGDAAIGANVNIGAGTITCNYDGQRKSQTTIDDGAFVGSDTTLVAPVTVGKQAYIAAGSTITADVPDGALGIARSRQSNKADWVAQRAASKGTAKARTTSAAVGQAPSQSELPRESTGPREP